MSNHYLHGKFSSFFTCISICCISVDVLTLLFGVFSRYLLGASPIWIDELSRYLMIGAVMLISGVVLLDGEHMRLNFIDKIKSEKLQKISRCYQYIIMTFVFGFLMYFSFTYAISISKFTTLGLGISKSIPMFSLPIGFLGLFLCSLINLIKSFCHLFSICSYQQEEV
ncbi:TRAP transporter small permease subunit [Vibrio sp. CAIM 722]|uniref:TRAP transporter small permease protein n=1 Tax=Vibrio eleionomae TaxID=2653505 RepID=A0A7X4RU09_9VIBR|nr:TRAP transporter small permease subunit [Vibrio eleionomae]